MARNDKQVGRLLQPLRQSPPAEAIARRNRIEVEVENALDEGDVERVGMKMSLLAIVQAPLAIHAIVVGAPHGWRDLERVSHLHAIGPRLVPEIRGKEALASLALAHLLALDETGVAGELARFVVESSSVRDDSRAWGRLHLPFFVVQLERMARGEAPRRDRPIGVYDAVLDAWDLEDERHLAKALRAACDYHLAQTSLNRGAIPPEFMGYDLVPVEIAAIRRARQRRGKATPPIDHPLLSTPLAEIPGPPARYRPADDPLVRRALALASAR